MRRGRACSLLHETWLGECSCVMSTLLRRFLKPGDAGGWFLVVKSPLYRSVKICKVKRHGAYRKSTDVPYRNVRTVLVRTYHKGTTVLTRYATYSDEFVCLFKRSHSIRTQFASTDVPRQYGRTLLVRTYHTSTFVLGHVSDMCMYVDKITFIGLCLAC